MAEQYIEFYKPKVLVVANDHNTINRCLVEVANRANVKTVYVQHAAVTSKFPPLNFSYAFLDGIDSFEKYVQAGKNKCTVFLSGGVRFDTIPFAKKKQGKDFVIGVALNMLDDKKLVQKLCVDLKEISVENKNIQLVLRPHPSIIMKPWQEWCSENKICFSLPTYENSFDFLNRIDFLISNQSSIHLDSVLCNTPSVIYNMAIRKPEDGYGFIKRGLVREAVSFDELVSYIMNYKSYVFNPIAARYYNSSFRTKFEGHVGEMISDMIDSLCNGTYTEHRFIEKYGFCSILTEGDFKVFGVEKSGIL